MDMNGFTLFLAIVFLVMGILQIILFFKVWGMTNYVKKLTQSITSPSLLDLANKAYLFGNKDAAKDLIEDLICQELTAIANTEYYTDKFFSEMYNISVNKHKQQCERMDIIVDFTKYSDRSFFKK